MVLGRPLKEKRINVRPQLISNTTAEPKRVLFAEILCQVGEIFRSFEMAETALPSLSPVERSGQRIGKVEECKKRVGLRKNCQFL